MSSPPLGTWKRSYKSITKHNIEDPENHSSLIRYSHGFSILYTRHHRSTFNMRFFTVMLTAVAVTGTVSHKGTAETRCPRPQTLTCLPRQTHRLWLRARLRCSSLPRRRRQSAMHGALYRVCGRVLLLQVEHRGDALAHDGRGA